MTPQTHIPTPSARPPRRASARLLNSSQSQSLAREFGDGGVPSAQTATPGAAAPIPAIFLLETSPVRLLAHRGLFKGVTT